ncbi:MAG TPA: hypothetical protein VF501_04670, partial [Thiobacillus sp.]
MHAADDGNEEREDRRLEQADEKIAAVDPPPTTITSKSRRWSPIVTAALSRASCNVLQRYRPILSRVNVV